MGNGEAGALTRDFGNHRDEVLSEAGLGDTVNPRGTEGRQRSTPSWVEAVQNEILRLFDDTQSLEAVWDLLRR